MKSELYKINNAVEKIKDGKNTNFLDGKELKLVTFKLKRKNYNVYYPYKDAEKVILYTVKVPEIKLFKIKTMGNLRHQDILGSLFGLNIDSSLFGDIVLYNNSYYVYLIYEISDFVKYNLIKIGKYNVSLQEVSLDLSEKFKRSYEECEIIVTSTRIDSVVASITTLSRTKVLEKIKNKEIIINYNIVTKGSYVLKPNDIFSIRKYGKYKFIGIIKSTKKNNYVIKFLKYL